ncbi:MAG TPA: Clp protease N-terminal domain-containing protein [Gemmatimonadaceae bacterium]|nr:Clp protease N-terminal domain-containing protein [Gemmatimonadaceae bacterium]
MNKHNFTERVRRALAGAREEAFALHHPYVGTEHLLLGLLRDEEGVSAAALKDLGASADELRAFLRSHAMPGSPASASPHDLPYASRAKKVLELAMCEARELGHSYVGTEHLLLGIAREEKGLGAQALHHSGLTVPALRAEILGLLGTEPILNPDPRPAAHQIVPFTARLALILSIAALAIALVALAVAIR